MEAASKRDLRKALYRRYERAWTPGVRSRLAFALHKT
jgi:hypothetical protein